MLNKETGDVDHVSAQHHPKDGAVDARPSHYPLSYEVVKMDSGKADVEHTPSAPMFRPYHSADYLGSPMGPEDNVAETGMLERIDRGARARRER